MPPALNATDCTVGEDDWVVGCCTCVVDVVEVFVVELVVDCPVLVPVPAQAETNNIITIAAVPTSIPWKRVNEIFCIVLPVRFKLFVGSKFSQYTIWIVHSILSTLSVYDDTPEFLRSLCSKAQ